MAAVPPLFFSISRKKQTVPIADVVQVQIHQRHFEGLAHQLVAVEGFIFRGLCLFVQQA